MKIQLIPHTQERKRELFGLIGELCADTKVHKALGAPINSRLGDLWLVATEAEEVTGICCLRALKSKPSLFINCLFTFDSSKLATQLRWAAEKEAKTLEMTEISVTDLLERQDQYLSEGWKPVIAHGKQYMSYRKAIK